MIRTPAILIITAFAGIAHAAPSDLIRFTNGDQLHGNYQGMNQDRQILWQREDIADTAKFKTDNLRHAILRDGNPQKSLGSLSQVDLVNGDCIPGTITALDNSSITLDTPCAGSITLPRNMVAGMAPNPLGGRIHYYGPFSSDGWEMIQPNDHQEKDPQEDEAAEPDTLPNENGNEPEPGEGDAAEPESWKQTGAAWYWKGDQNQQNTALIRRDALPEQSILRFQLAWRSRPIIAIGINTDFNTAPAEIDGAEKKRQGNISSSYRTMPLTFGNGHVLRIQSNYLSIYRTGIDEKGKPICESISSTNNRLPTEDANKANFEIRSNLTNGDMILFVNGQFITQWNAYGQDLDRENARKQGILMGSGFGFLPIHNDSRLRVSEVVITDWNGMPDSARSTQSDDRDVVLMSNGLDRIAGKATTITDEGALVFNSKHGEFRIPLDEIAQIRFAKNTLAESPSHSPDATTVRFSPIGNISGEPLSATRDTMKIKHPILGEIEFSTESAVMFEFNASSSLINDWDADF